MFGTVVQFIACSTKGKPVTNVYIVFCFYTSYSYRNSGVTSKDGLFFVRSTLRSGLCLDIKNEESVEAATGLILTTS